jgi:hypothetical protein
MATRQLRVWTGSAWEIVNPTAVIPTYYQDSAPTSPVTGAVWVDSDSTASSLNQNDYVLKSEIDAYAPQPLSAFLLMGA